MGAAVDCETIGPGLLGQPLNAISSLALAIAGIWLLGRIADRWIGLGLIATGVGSFLFHGPLAPGGVWVHDVTLAWLLAVILVELRRWPTRIHLFGLGLMALVFWLLPSSADVIMVAVVLAIVGALVTGRRTRATWTQLGALATVAIIGRLGATGGPICDPDSVLQPHALWHLGAAGVVAWWATSRHIG
jgi:hypothetical protein